MSAMTQSPSRPCTTAYQAAVSTQVASAPPCRYSGPSPPCHDRQRGRIEAQDRGAVLEAVQRQTDAGVEARRREREQLRLGHARDAASRRRRMPSVSISTAPASVSGMPACGRAEDEERQAGARDRAGRLALRAPGGERREDHERRGERERDEGVVAHAQREQAPSASARAPRARPRRGACAPAPRRAPRPGRAASGQGLSTPRRASAEAGDADGEREDRLRVRVTERAASRPMRPRRAPGQRSRRTEREDAEHRQHADAAQSQKRPSELERGARLAWPPLLRERQRARAVVRQSRPRARSRRRRGSHARPAGPRPEEAVARNTGIDPTLRARNVRVDSRARRASAPAAPSPRARAASSPRRPSRSPAPTSRGTAAGTCSARASAGCRTSCRTAGA